MGIARSAPFVALVLLAGAGRAEGQDVPTWGDPEHKSWVIPAVEIVTFEVLLNLYDRNYQREDAYRSDLDSIKANLRRGWVIDDDPFAMNQMLHPYNGSLTHGFARSAGLSYWETLPYDIGGSVLWEIAGETEAPSINDLIATSFGGSFFGEALFRMAGLLLEDGGRKPGFAREAGAFLVSPPLGVNRLAFDRFDAVFPSRDPAVFAQSGVGATRNAHLRDVDAVAEISKDAFFLLDFSMAYGLPGKPGYEYDRPFDYFQLEAVATSSSGALPESVMTRGLLYGSGYEWGGDSGHGIWGLYGVYEYMSPDVFSVSSTALCVGTTAQYRISKAVTGQGTLLAGLGYTAVGTIADASEDRDFHYGSSPQGLLALRFIFGDTATLDFSGREYYVTGSRRDSGRENVLRGEVKLTVRVYGNHGLGARFVSTVRNSDFFDVEEGLEAVGAVSVFYTYLSDPDFGVVK
jgi:hypothetical protein